MIADDLRLVRQLFATFIATNPELRLVGEAATGAATLGVAIAEQPDILVLDLELGDLRAEEIIDDLRLFCPGTRILLYSDSPDVHQRGQLLNVDRAVGKGDDIEQLLGALLHLAR